jgi:hypothetical protein
MINVLNFVNKFKNLLNAFLIIKNLKFLKSFKIKNITIFILTVIIFLCILGFVKKEFLLKNNTSVMIEYKDIEKFYIKNNDNIYSLKIIVEKFFNDEKILNKKKG